MTVLYESLEPGLANLFVALMSPQVDLVLWENQERVMVERSYLVLSWVADAEVNTPQLTYAESAGQLQETSAVAHVLTLQVTCESFSQLPDEHALLYLSRLRSRLRWTQSLEVLRGLGLAIVDFEAVRRNDYVIDDRNISRATFDARFNYASNETDEQVFLEYIETVEISSDIDDIDGLPLDSDMQLNEKVMP